jgi:type IV secretory pathway VirB2 component (pilin)
MCCSLDAVLAVLGKALCGLVVAFGDDEWRIDQMIIILIKECKPVSLKYF